MKKSVSSGQPFLHWIGQLLIMLATVGLLPPGLLQAQSHPDEQPLPEDLSRALRNRIEGGLSIDRISASGTPILARRALPLFYQARDFRLAWFEGAKSGAGREELLQALRTADEEGLRAYDYHLGEIEPLLSGMQSGRSLDIRLLVDAELLLTDAFLIFASHLHQGRVNPQSIQPEWLANRRNTEYARVLGEALGGTGVKGALERLRPRNREYIAFRDALRRLRADQRVGGWLRVVEGETLRRGDEHPRVGALRRRLQASQDLPISEPLTTANVFDQELEEAVIRFQRRHGLEPDGVVGRTTLAALNMPLEERIRQIEANMERWRWLPDDLGVVHIRVNIAGFGVEVWESQDVALRLRAIVGREYRQTPSFTGQMSYLVLAPAWHVPPGIAINDKLPLIKKDPGYVAAQQMSLLDASTNLVVNPLEVGWNQVTGGNFNRKFRLRQSPGSHNALGHVKFMFPNPYNVYLHDTPQRELFDRTERSFSSGCIRIDRPLELAEYLLRDDPAWTRERMDQIVARSAETAVTLRTKLPVHLLYWTAWVGDEGLLHFRRDLYGRDTRLLKALAEPAPEL